MRPNCDFRMGASTLLVTSASVIIGIAFTPLLSKLVGSWYMGEKLIAGSG